MAVADAVRKIAEAMGLSDEVEQDLLADGSSPSVDFDQELPGTAAEVLELFLGESGESFEDDEKGWIWAPMIRSGQHAMRPGAKGQKVRTPLKVVAGKSKDPLKQIGLGDLVDAFQRDAVDYVTVPQSHGNGPLENTGFIRDMKVKSAPIASGPKKGEKVPTLFGAYDFTEPDVRGKVKRGSVPGRSCGILYNYENTETGEQFPSVVEHVALTSKPWIRGMTPFGRRLSEGHAPPVAMSLSDEPLVEDTIVSELADDGEASSATISWSHEDSPSWIRDQIQSLLDAARRDRRKTQSNLYVEEPAPWYRAREVKPDGSAGRALVCDGYGDGSNYWVAGYRVEDGAVELDEFKDWQAVKSVYVSDDRDPPQKKDEPLEEEDPPSRIQIARERRKARARGEDYSQPSKTTTHPRGGVKMEGSNGSEDKNLQLSEEAKRQLDAANARAEAAERRAEVLEGRVDRFADRSRRAEVSEFLNDLRAIGLDEKHGQTGLLNEVEKMLLEDDGEPAVVSEVFSEDGKSEVELSLTDAFRRVFGAIKKGEDGKIALGEQLEQPSDDAERQETEDDGKPAKDDEGDDDLSDDPDKARERAEKLAEDNPELAAMTGIAPSKSTEGGDQ